MSQYANQRDDNPAKPLNLELINFSTISPDLFDGIANETAEVIAQARNNNKSTQLRKYYDELAMWEQKIKQNPDKYGEYLPLIKMLNAKVAYANGRKLVDDNFVKLMRRCLDQVTDDRKSFATCKLFFEAFMGFYKMHKPN